jgi:5-methylthioadenosine/S-adenosylhomocysteine deaminase
VTKGAAKQRPVSYDLGVRAGRLLSMKGGEPREERDMFLGVSGGAIACIEKFKPAHKKASKKFIDARLEAVVPGFVNGHTHLPMSLMRGVAEDLSFHDWLFERVLPLEAALVSREFVRDGLELALLECIRFGVTCVNEMYFFAEEEAKVVDRVGIRATIAQCMASFPLPEDKAVGTDKFAIVERLRAKYAKHPRVRIGLGPHAPYSCDDDLLKSVRDYAARTGAPVHIHLSETAREVAESREKYGVSPVARLQKLGLLHKGVICAHCVHFDAADRVAFQGTGASMTHNPDSNAKLGAGVAPVTDYLLRGISVALGTDGAASNNDLSMFGAMDLGTKLQKLHTGSITAFGAADALRMATWGGARAMGLGDVCGSLEVGKRADFAFLDLSAPNLQPVLDLPALLVYSAQGGEVSGTVCEGKVLYRHGKFTTLEPKKIYARTESWRRKIVKALEARK